MAISTYLSIITFNVKRLFQSKDIGWLIGLKNKTLQYAAYKGISSGQIHTEQKRGDGKRYFMKSLMTRKW